MAEGIKELKELASVTASLASGISHALSDGTINWADVWHFKDFAVDLVPAIRGISNVGREFDDLTPDEETELRRHFEDKLKLHGDHENVERYVESGVGMALQLARIIVQSSKT